MRFAGLVHRLSSPAAPLIAVRALATCAVLVVACPATLHAQQAPQVLPYTMSTYAGPHAAYTPGAKCGNLTALDAIGDGCLASQMSVGPDPHDVRVDGKGFVYFQDTQSSSSAVIHKINPLTGVVTVAAGSNVNTKACSGQTDKYGDGCPATDGAANNNPNVLTTAILGKPARGLAAAPNGDIFTAGYGDFEIHRISAASGTYSIYLGSANGYLDGPIASAQIGSNRGVGVDPSGNVFIADTANNVIRMVSNGIVSTLTKVNSSSLKQVDTNVPANTAYVNAPEDVQADFNGNIYIADQGNGAVRAIYMGKGTLPGIANPQKGYIYTLAGGFTAVAGTTYYPANGTSPAVAGTATPVSVRKLAVDLAGNVYVADSTNNVVWFIDGQTGYIRVIAGSYGQTASISPTFTCNNPGSPDPNLGDGCPGFKASLYASSDMGTSPDNQGNLYITDAEGGSGALSRIRKLLSGLVFPAVAVGTTPVTQTVWIHFAAGDNAASSGAYTISGTDFAAGTAACTTQTDNTTDCFLPVTFTPTKPGYDTATLTVKSAKGVSSTFTLAGTGNTAVLAVDPGAVSVQSATVKNPGGIYVDANSNTYIADTANNRVVMIPNGGSPVVLAGTGTSGFSGDGGAATAAQLKAPRAVAVDTAGNVYIADSGNNVIRKVTVATGKISTFAGGASAVCAGAFDTLGDGCSATQATLSNPSGLASDRVGNIYIADTGNNLLRQVNVFGFVSLLAGGSQTICPSNSDTFGDGCPGTQAFFNAPSALAIDNNSNYLIVADAGDNIVRKVYLGNSINVINSTGTATAVINPILLVAGNGQAGSSVDASLLATNSQLNAPLGVATDAAGNIYIADTGNSAVRLVNAANGNISTIAGILGSSGAGTASSAADITLTAPAAVAVNPAGQLYIADTGNNRVLLDDRTHTGYNFGRIIPGAASSSLALIAVSVGNQSLTLPSTIPAGSGDTADFTLTSPNTAGCNGAVLAPGAECTLLGTFTPVSTGPYSASYSYGAGTPVITLTGTGALLTATTSTIAQTSPATGNAQFGSSLVLTVTVKPSTCNASAPSGCTPAGTVRISVDGTAGQPTTLSSTGTASQTFSGLSVGPHTVTCAYAGDGFYSASSCPTVSITVAAASTTPVLSVNPGTVVQYLNNVNSTCVPDNPITPATYTCTEFSVSANVTASTSGIPSGSVTFFAGTTKLGTASLNAAGSASLPVTYTYDIGGNLLSDNTLVPGSYQLTCTFTPAGTTSNFASSSCSPVPFTVKAQTAGISIVTKGCSTQATAATVTSAPNEGHTCPAAVYVGGVPAVTTAQGSTTDAAIFITPANTASGTLTFACSGLPAHSTCTFSPTSVTLTPSTSFQSPIPVDVTLWTDIQSTANTNHNLRGNSGIQYALIIGWPITLLGFGGLFVSRRKLRNVRFLAAIPLAMVLLGGSLLAGGCAGPGDYVAQLTPAGQYPVTITVTGQNGLAATTKVVFVVTSPGLPGIQ